jgi:hypothetical protein
VEKEDGTRVAIIDGQLFGESHRRPRRSSPSSQRMLHRDGEGGSAQSLLNFTPLHSQTLSWGVDEALTSDPRLSQRSRHDRPRARRRRRVLVPWFR